MNSRFGGSYDPVSDPAGIVYYVDAFLLLFKHVGLNKVHVVGHHTGASVGIEMASLHPDIVLSLTVSGPAVLTEEEQLGSREQELVCFNYPVSDGSHLQKTWSYAWGYKTWDPVDFHPYLLEVARAYQGRIQAYTCVFHHDILKALGEVKCPILNLTADGDMLSSYTKRVKEIVSFSTSSTKCCTDENIRNQIPLLDLLVEGIGNRMTIQRTLPKKCPTSLRICKNDQKTKKEEHSPQIFCIGWMTVD